MIRSHATPAKADILICYKLDLPKSLMQGCQNSGILYNYVGAAIVQAKKYAMKRHIEEAADSHK